MAERIWIFRNILRCSGCRLCEIACALHHEGRIWPEASRIRVFELVPGINVPHLCAQCDDYPCAKICPTGALYTDGVTGAVLVDATKCVKCGKCISACPGKVPRILPQKSHVIICDLCGGSPACVAACEEAGHGALRLIRGVAPKDYKVFARDPWEISKEYSSQVYCEEVLEE